MCKKSRRVPRSNRELASKWLVNRKQAFKDPKIKMTLEEYFENQSLKAPLETLNPFITNYIYRFSACLLKLNCFGISTQTLDSRKERRKEFIFNINIPSCFQMKGMCFFSVRFVKNGQKREQNSENSKVQYLSAFNRDEKQATLKVLWKKH